MQAIGYVHSCFKEKFAIPRQPGLVPAARASIKLLPPYNQAQALAGLEQVSHIWVVFVFHLALQQQQRLQVRPPRLGGNQRLGVFASRASHRPNSIGQSLVRLEQITPEGSLKISGHDLLDGTPVLDIKPYIPFVESLPEAQNLIANQPPPLLQVDWQATALKAAQAHAKRLNAPLVELVEQCLAQDPRPAYQQAVADRYYGSKFYDVEVRWRYPQPQLICITEITETT